MHYDIAHQTSRRTFLKGLGVTMALPWMESLGGTLFAADPAKEPRRILLICVPLGLYRGGYAPEESPTSTPDFNTPYLRHLKGVKDQLTLITGLDHPGVNGGHGAEPRIFSGIPSANPSGISLDQYIAGKIGAFTRFESLTLSAGRNNFSYTSTGAMVPPISSMSELYEKLFLQTPPNRKKEVQAELRNGRSVLDFLQDEAARLKPKLSNTDQGKLDEYFENVRGTEMRLAKAEQWLGTPKPKVKMKAPVDPASKNAITASIQNAFDMIQLAFETDSTRVITLGYFRQGDVDVPGVSIGYHPLSHHGQDPENIRQLMLVEEFFFQRLGEFLVRMANTREGNASLLDRTTVLVTSNLGNGSGHSNKDLPVIMAGGRYQHGNQIAFEKSTVPMTNLFVTMLNQMGLPDTSWTTSTGPLRGFNLG